MEMRIDLVKNKLFMYYVRIYGSCATRKQNILGIPMVQYVPTYELHK